MAASSPRKLTARELTVVAAFPSNYALIPVTPPGMVMSGART